MDWSIEQSDVLYNVTSDALHIRPFTMSKVLYGVVAQINEQVMTSPAPGDRYTRGFLTGQSNCVTAHE